MNIYTKAFQQKKIEKTSTCIVHLKQLRFISKLKIADIHKQEY